MISPAWHSCTMAPGSAGRPPVSSQAWQVPSVGCPANGSSRGRREDPDQVVGPARPRRQHERGLRQVRPAREQLHLLAAQAVGAEHDRDRVTEVRGIGEDIHLAELMCHKPKPRGGVRPRRQGQFPGHPGHCLTALPCGDAKPAAGHRPGQPEHGYLRHRAPAAGTRRDRARLGGAVHAGREGRQPGGGGGQARRRRAHGGLRRRRRLRPAAAGRAARGGGGRRRASGPSPGSRPGWP